MKILQRLARILQIIFTLLPAANIQTLLNGKGKGKFLKTIYNASNILYCRHIKTAERFACGDRLIK